MKFFILGSTGMAGHLIAIFLQEQGHDVITFSRRHFPFCKNIVGDAFDVNLLKKVISEEKFDVVINCIGILNNLAETRKDKAAFLNGYLPHYISYITKDLPTKVIQLSTDCVFSGRTGNYNEGSFKDGETFYDRSKALGELINHKDLTFRNSIIGPDIDVNGVGLFNWFMKQQREINGYKAIWTGVTTLTLAKAIERATEENLVGLYHLVNNEFISKYELLHLFNKYFRNGELIINKSDDVIVDKSLINTRTDFDFMVPSYAEMIKEMKEWIVNHKALYPHYF